MSNSRLGVSSLWILTSRSGGLVLAFAVAVILARGLGPEGRGEFALVYLVPTLVVMFVNLGMGTATGYQASRKWHPLSLIVGNAVMACIVLSLAGMAAASAAMLYLRGGMLIDAPTTALILAVLLVPGILFAEILQWVVLSTGTMAAYCGLSLFQKAAWLVLLLGAMAYFPRSLVAAMAATLAAVSLHGIAVLAVAWRAAGETSPRLRPDFRYLTATTWYGLRVHPSTLLSFLNYRLDIFLLGIFVTSSSIGYYSVAASLAERLWILSSSVSLALFVSVAGETDTKARRERTPLVARMVLVLTAAGAVVLFTVIPLLTTWFFGSEFMPLVKAFRILLPGIVLLGVSRVLATDIAARGRPGLNAAFSFVGVVLNILLNLLWIPRYGITGAAAASTFSYSLVLVGRLPVYAWVSGNPWYEPLYVRISDGARFWTELKRLTPR